METPFDPSLDGDAVTLPLGAAGDTCEVADEAASLGTDTFSQPLLGQGQCEQLTNHILPPSLRHGQCDQLTNHILPSSPSVTASAINSLITFCHPPLRHCQCDQLTNHILPPSPPTRPMRSTHQSHSAIVPLRHGQCYQLTNHILTSSPSATASAINSPITF